MRLTPPISSTPPPAVSVTAHNGQASAGRWLMFSFAVVALVLAGFTGTVKAADIYLRAQAFGKILTLPDASTVTVPMWGFASCDATFTTCDPPATTDAPGPTISLSTSDSLTIHLNNTLSVPVSIVIPGQAGGGDPETMASDPRRMQSFTHETAAGNTGTYTWSTLNPGTYLYQSGTQPSLQVPMGLYGALTVVDGVAGQAYPGISYDADAVLLFSEIDPLQNQRVADAAVALAEADCDTLADFKLDPVANNGYPCTIDYNPKFFLVNGAPTADNLPAGNGTTTQNVLLRLLNAGLRSHTPSLVGIEMGLVAEDGNPYPGQIRQQSGALLPAGKTLDTLVAMPAADVTYALFDHLPTFRNEGLPNNGGASIATLQVGTGTPPPPAATIYTVNDTYAVPEDANPFTAPASVLANDVGLSGATVTVVNGPLNGSIAMNPNGTFTYTPAPDYSGIDGFTYSADDGTNTYPGQATLEVSFVNDVPVAAADGPYVNTIGTDITIDAAHGVLGNDTDPDGDTLTAVIDGTAPAGLTLNPDGSFVYTGGVPASFSYHASDGTAQSNTVTVTLNLNPVSSIALTVQDPDGSTLTQYRWLLQEDKTYHINPASPPDPSDTLSTRFHKSYMPVIAQSVTQDCGVETDTSVCDPNTIDPGQAFSQVALDPTKYYYVSILPNDAGTGMGHTIGGAQILPGQTAVTVVVNKQEIPTAQISVIVFEDISPTNGVPDPTEPGLGGYQITLEDAGGRYGQVGGTMSQDAYGNPLTNSAPCAPPATAGVILTCDDGTALIKDLPPGKYGVIAVAPAGAETWTQTSTIEGTKVQDTWVIAGEPPFLVEFGAPGYHAFIGFVNPDHTKVPGNIPPGQLRNTITGNVTMIHPERAPSQQAFDSGSYDALAHTRAWVGLNSIAGDGPNIATVQAAEDGSFTIGGIPDGTYQLVIWDTYLDQIISYQTVILSGGTTDVGNIPVPVWFGRHEHTVFLDDGAGGGIAMDGKRNGSEVGLPEQAVNLRFRDGTVFQSYPTDTTGFVPFDQIFPFGAWQVAEVDYTRFKPTGVTVTVDGGGDVSGGPYPGLLNPQVGSPRTDLDPAPVLLEGFQSMPSMTSIFEWGKVPYALDENGGIAGIVFYGSTRGEEDPRLTVGDPWEPGIPGVKVRLYREVATDFAGGTALALVQEVETDSWDANTPAGCQGENPASVFVTDTLNGDATRCYDGVRNFEQVQPAVFDGGYAFNNIPPGKYVVEVVLPPGYELIKEQDMNVGFGDSFGPGNSFAPVSVTLPNGMLVTVVPDQAMIDAAKGPEPGLAQPPCVGAYQIVPAELSLFPGEPAPFAGAGRPLCNRKQVILSDQGQAAADFHLFTSTPVAGQFQGLTTDDIAIETDPASPSYGDKWGPAFLPISMRDYNGHEIYRTFSDAFGHYNGVLPSTFTANIPVPSGYSPAMHFVCLNDPGPLPGGGLDPLRNPNYGTFCYTLMYMPGTTTYLDTPLLPNAAFAAGFNSVDCAGTDRTPVVQQVDGTGVGPVVAPGGMLTIYSRGMTSVPNPDYEGPLGSALPTIQRDYGFGASGSVTLNGVSLTGVTWNDGVITGNVPAGITGDAQLVVTRNDSGSSSINTVTVTVTNNVPARVMAGGSIQAAIDAASAGDLILVEPGTYDELVVMWKPVRLQGSGASTIINALKLPTQKLLDWRAKVMQLLNAGSFDLLPGQPGPDFDLVGAGLFGTELGAGITVLAKNDGSYSNNPSRIDGFTIGGADGGGGIFVNGFAHNLQISNNQVTGNSGVLHGGIRIGQPFLPLTGDGPFGYNTGVNIHHNSITLNGAQGENGAGGGLALNTGTDNYHVSGNYICGNFNLCDGAGIGHLGLSDNGTIEFNQILFNQTFNQGLSSSGGGISIAGEPSAAGGLTLGAGDITVDGNLIQGNHAATGHGGGIRTQFVNGRDVELSPNQPANWHQVRITNNMIVNNVAGWSGAGMSLQDTANASIILNTIANNDSTATVGAVYNATTNMSTRQPAGISSERHSLGLDAVIPGNQNSRRNFSNPELTHNIIWHNRAFTYDATTATPRLLPVLNQAATGDCPAGADYFDLGVLDPGFSLSPQRNILTSTTGYPNNNVTANPSFLSAYCNGARTLSMPGPIQVASEPVEGGNLTDVRYGPLTQAWPVGSAPWNYHIAANSPAIDRNGVQPSGANVNHDFDDQGRPNGPRVDWGADESGSGGGGGGPGTVAFQSASEGTLSGGTLAFGSRNGVVLSTLTLAVSGGPVQFGSVTVQGGNGNRFVELGGTCQNQTLAGGGTCTVVIAFIATGNGNRTGGLTVNHDGSNSPLTLVLTGQ